MAIDQTTLDGLRQDYEAPPVDLSWLDAGSQWGMRARPGKRGLTLDEINIGVYGEVPEHSRNLNARPRGAVARPEAPRIGYPLEGKSDVWSENAVMLYEEAVQRQWSSATDIPWETLGPLPDDLERAMCQLCTFLTEVEFIAGDTPGQWLPKISNDHYEVKLFLTTQINDEARHLDVFRKRALANGGGLLKSSPTGTLRTIINARDFTEMSALMHVQAEGFVQSMFRMGELIAQNEAEKRIFRLCAQDESRHLGFGVMHLKYIVENEPWRKEELHHYLDQVEGPLSLDLTQAVTAATPYFDEAIMILAGGGLKNVDVGMERLMGIRRRQVNEYMHRLEVAGMSERRDRMNPFFRSLLDPPRN